METPIEVLRVEQSGISKELARFRACDAETRSLYCREWAQFVYKKHFVWNAKTQEEVPESQQQNAHGGLQAGPYQINFISDETAGQDDVYKKERSALMIKKFMSLVESWATTPASADEESLITQIVQACKLWMTLPSGYSGLPDLFEPVEFNPYPDAIPLVEDPKDPSQLLDPLIIERQALCLPSDCFHLLKNLTGDILLSHTTPTCNHSKPTSKTPADLDVDRNIFNEHEAVAVKKALAELKIALEQAWHPLNNFLGQLAEFDKRRSRLMGKGCKETIDEYFASQNFVSFVDIWAKQAANFKNKKSTPEEIAKVDSLFQQHLERMKELVHEFMTVFAVAHLKEIHVLTTDLWKMIVPTIYELGERMATHEDHKGNKNANASKIGESLKALDIDSLKKMESTKEVDAAQTRILDSLTKKTTDYISDIDNLLKSYHEGRGTLSGRLEKLNNKDFKKKIKKVESGYYSIRQTFRYEVTENIFPEALFCKFSLVCLEPLMQEGEVMEAVTIEKEVKRFVESHKDLLQKKCNLLEEFEQGVQTGRRELAGVLGKLFLKEGMRIQGDNLALKRQQSLLKSMGVASEDQPKKKTKSKKKSSATSSGTTTPALVEEPVKKAPVKEKAPSKEKAAVNDKIAAAHSEKKTPTAERKEVVPEKKADVIENKVDTTKKKDNSNADAADKKSDNVKKPKAAEKKPAAVDKKPTVSEKESVVDSKPAIPEKEPPIAKKKPSAPEMEPTVEKKKPVVPEIEPAVPEKKSNAVEQKPEPVVEKKKPVKAVGQKNKKKESVAVENEDKKVISPINSNAIQDTNANQTSWPTDQSNDIQDWDTIRSSVMTAEANINQLEPEVQDWETLRAQVMLSNEKKPTATVSGGWSSVAAAAATSATLNSPSPVQPSSKKSTTPITSTTITAASPSALDQWSAPATKSPQWSNVAASSNSTATADNGWSKVASISSEVKDMDLGGCSTPAPSANTNASTAARSKISSTTSGWNSDKKPWASPSAEKKKQSKWSDDNESNLSLGGWESSSAAVGGSSADANWRSSSKKTTAATPLSAPSWDNAKLPWDDEPTTAATSSIAATPIKENVKKPPVVQSAVTSNPTSVATSEHGILSPVAQPPPGMIASNNVTASPAPPPGIQAPKVMPPGLATPIASTVSTPHAATPSIHTSNSFNPIGMSTTPLLPTANQLQEPLPHDLEEMSSDMLLLIVKNLHRENGSLIQSVYNMQQEMGMMTSRYAEIIALARERETQTLALFESRKQTEMEEARRLVLSLEARVKQLEEQGQEQRPKASTAGFGNQDLFAGYREEMVPQQQSPQQHHNHNHRNHTRKLWQKNSVVRCSNCGEVGHASQECKVNIEYIYKVIFIILSNLLIGILPLLR